MYMGLRREFGNTIMGKDLLYFAFIIVLLFSKHMFDIYYGD